MEQTLYREIGFLWQKNMQMNIILYYNSLLSMTRCPNSGKLAREEHAQVPLHSEVGCFSSKRMGPCVSPPSFGNLESLAPG